MKSIILFLIILFYILLLSILFLFVFKTSKLSEKFTSNDKKYIMEQATITDRQGTPFINAVNGGFLFNSRNRCPYIFKNLRSARKACLNNVDNRNRRLPKACTYIQKQGYLCGGNYELRYSRLNPFKLNMAISKREIRRDRDCGVWRHFRIWAKKEDTLYEITKKAEKSLSRAIKAEKEKTRINNELSKSEQEKTRINNELSKSEKEKTKINNELSKSEQEKTRINNELNKSKQDKTKINNELNKSKQEKTRINNELNKSKQERIRLNNELNKSKQERIRMNNEFNKIKEELNKKIQKSNNTANSSENDKKELNLKLNAIKTQLSSYEEKISKSEKEKKQINDELTDTKSQLKISKETNEKSKKRILEAEDISKNICRVKKINKVTLVFDLLNQGENSNAEIKLNDKTNNFKLPKTENKKFKNKHKILWELSDPILKPSYIDVKIIVDSSNSKSITIKNAKIIIEGINHCNNLVSFKNENKNVFKTKKNNNKPYWEYSLNFDKSFRKKLN